MSEGFPAFFTWRRGWSVGRLVNPRELVGPTCQDRGVTTNRGVLLRAVLATAAVSVVGCGDPSECAIGTQRCHGEVPQLCIQSPTLSAGVGLWIGAAACTSGKVCRVDQGGTASCVVP